MEEAKFSDYLDKNPTETMEVMTDTLSDKLSEAAENGVDVDETIDSVANFAVNITNPLNYDAPTDSLETMGENIRKNNKKDIGDKLDERMAALVGDPSLNYGPVDSGYDDKTDLNHDEVSFEMDGHRIDVDTYKTDDGFERIVTIDYEEVPDSTINESIENAVQDVSNNVDPIVSACTSDKPLEDSVDKYITSNDEIVTKEDLINALEKVKTEIPKVLQNLDLILVDSDKAVDKIVDRAVDNAINSLIEDITGINVKGTINDIKHDIADKISDAINDMVKDLSGVDVKGTIDELKDKAIDKLCDIINDTLSNRGVSPEMDNFDTPNVDIPEGNGLGDILDSGIEGVGEGVVDAVGDAMVEAVGALIV